MLIRSGRETKKKVKFETKTGFLQMEPETEGGVAFFLSNFGEKNRDFINFPPLMEEGKET